MPPLEAEAWAGLAEVHLDFAAQQDPEIFIEEISSESKRTKISKQLILSLIKQESSFQIDVKSTAGALGLMQLMPVTAKEIAGDLKIKISDNTDLLKPNINIRIGTYYLNRRLRFLNENVPMALAAYNAGIGNLRSWLRARHDLDNLEKNMSFEPVSELWLDELPWFETSNYVKAILRNYLVYKLLDQSNDLNASKIEIELKDPIWKFNEES